MKSDQASRTIIDKIVCYLKINNKTSRWLLFILVSSCLFLIWAMIWMGNGEDFEDEGSVAALFISDTFPPELATAKMIVTTSSITSTSASASTSASTSTASSMPQKQIPWGLQKIIDPFRDAVIFTIIRPSQLNELRQLVGSIHQWRPLASQAVPIIHVFGNRIQAKEINEISLWRNVIFQDIKHVLTPFQIFTADDLIHPDSKLKVEESGMREKQDAYDKQENKELIKKLLVNRLVQMYGHAIYLEIGEALFTNAIFKIIKVLSKDHYIALRSIFGKIILEAFILDTMPFKCKIQATWDPSLKDQCKEYESANKESLLVSNAIDFEIDSAPENDDEQYNFECNICIRDDAHHGWRLFYKNDDMKDKMIITEPLGENDISNYTNQKAGNVSLSDHDKSKEREIRPIKVALAFPTTSKRTKTFWELPFLSTFLPSIVKSITKKEVGRFELAFYIGYDEKDRFYDDKDFETLKRISVKVRKSFSTIGIKKIAITYVRLGISRAVTYIWNVLFSLAMYEGADYFYQLNDDVRFDSTGWLGTFVDQLKRNNNFGVVGPNDPGFDCKIMTQTMTSSLHYRIFGWYFPPDYRNWQCDTWISLVYSMHTKCYEKMRIWNGLYGTTAYSPRYVPCKSVAFKPLVYHYQALFRNETGQIDPHLYD